MAELQTRADSLRIYLTGAASDGGTQADPNASLGHYRAATELEGLSDVITSPIANITVDYIAGDNGTGTGSLTASSSDELQWTPPAPNDTQGDPVEILDGESKILEGGAADGANQYIRVTRTSATALTGTASIAIDDPLNRLWDNVTSAEASAGDAEYRALMLKNESADVVGSLKVYLATLGTQAASDVAQLASSGSGTISTGDDLSDWPESGFVRITTSGATLREICYYSSRTATDLTVPTAGRGLLGTSAAAGAADDTLDAVPGIRIAKEAPSSSHIQTIANESAAPTGVTFNTGIVAGTGLSIGDLNPGDMYGLWIHRAIPAGAKSAASVLDSIKFSFDSI